VVFPSTGTGCSMKQVSWRWIITCSFFIFALLEAASAATWSFLQPAAAHPSGIRSIRITNHTLFRTYYGTGKFEGGKPRMKLGKSKVDFLRNYEHILETLHDPEFDFMITAIIIRGKMISSSIRSMGNLNLVRKSGAGFSQKDEAQLAQLLVYLTLANGQHAFVSRDGTGSKYFSLPPSCPHGGVIGVTEIQGASGEISLSATPGVWDLSYDLIFRDDASLDRHLLARYGADADDEQMLSSLSLLDGTDAGLKLLEADVKQRQNDAETLFRGSFYSRPEFAGTTIVLNLPSSTVFKSLSDVPFNVFGWGVRDDHYKLYRAGGSQKKSSQSSVSANSLIDEAWTKRLPALTKFFATAKHIAAAKVFLENSLQKHFWVYSHTQGSSSNFLRSLYDRGGIITTARDRFLLQAIYASAIDGFVEKYVKNVQRIFDQRGEVEVLRRALEYTDAGTARVNGDEGTASAVLLFGDAFDAGTQTLTRNQLQEVEGLISLAVLVGSKRSFSFTLDMTEPTVFTTLLVVDTIRAAENGDLELDSKPLLELVVSAISRVMSPRNVEFLTRQPVHFTESPFGRYSLDEGGRLMKEWMNGAWNADPKEATYVSAIDKWLENTQSGVVDRFSALNAQDTDVSAANGYVATPERPPTCSGFFLASASSAASSLARCICGSPPPDIAEVPYILGYGNHDTDATPVELSRMSDSVLRAEDVPFPYRIELAVMFGRLSNQPGMMSIDAIYTSNAFRFVNMGVTAEYLASILSGIRQGFFDMLQPPQPPPPRRDSPDGGSGGGGSGTGSSMAVDEADDDTTDVRVSYTPADDIGIIPSYDISITNDMDSRAAAVDDDDDDEDSSDDDFFSSLARDNRRDIKRGRIQG